MNTKIGNSAIHNIVGILEQVSNTSFATYKFYHM